jgi:hypothetical protein
MSTSASQVNSQLGESEVMNNLVVSLVFGAALLCGVGHANAEPITPAGQQLSQVIDSLDVEHHWPAGEHVSWETGIPDGKPESGTGKHTHCSAFVASAAKRVGIYVLRPPEHGQILLANAQYDWLAAEGSARGWKPLADGIEAQRYANDGWLVLATYKNHHDDKPGHIAIVRPSDKDARAVREEGPQVTQAGATNYRSIALRVGFSGHPAAWENHEVVYYAHAVDAAALGSSGIRSENGRAR